VNIQIASRNKNKNWRLNLPTLELNDKRSWNAGACCGTRARLLGTD
jgi:hypothetical protein